MNCRLIGIVLVACVLGGCPNTGPTLATKNRARTTLEASALKFSQRLKLGSTAVKAEYLGQVEAASLDRWAGRIVDGITTIRVENGKVTQQLFVSDPTFQTKRDQTASSLRASGLVNVGDLVLKMTWTIDGLPPFDTLAVTDTRAVPRFEPVLHFGAVRVDESNVFAQQHSWTIDNIAASWENGFGAKCAKAEWQVAAQTNQCKITDPAPHVREVACSKNCWFWDILCTDGEIPYTQPGEVCQTEECFKWVTQAKIATGTGKIEVEAGAQGEYNGVKLKLKVKTTAGSIGGVDSWEHIGNVCADTRPIVDGVMPPIFALEAGEPVSIAGRPFPPTCCRCSIRHLPDPEREGCPDRVFASVAEGTSIGDCQHKAIATAPERCRAYMKHCDWVNPRRCENPD